MIVTRNWGVSASELWVARIFGAGIVVVTTVWCVDALVIGAGIDRAFVLVITCKGVSALSVHANISSASVIIVAIKWSVDASLLCIASINSARVIVIASSIVDCIYTPKMHIARVLGACNSIVAVLCSLDTSVLLTKFGNNASVLSNTRNWMENTFSSPGITNSNLGFVFA